MNTLKFLLPVYLLLCFIGYSQAQAPAIQWQKCLGGSAAERISSIQLTSDGGYIVSGTTFSNNGDVSGNHGIEDTWIVKFNGSGIIQWQKCFGGTNVDNATTIQPTTDGGFIVAGSTHSNDGDVFGNHSSGFTDMWILKLSDIGNIQWQKCLGGTNYDGANSIQQTSDGGYIIGGYTRSNNGDVSGLHAFVDDAWVVKLNSTGNIQWQKCLGGTNDDYASSILQTADGGYIMMGYTWSTDGDVSGSHGGGYADVWVVKLNSIGNIQWQKCLGGSDDDNAKSIITTLDGGYILVGQTMSNDGDVSGNHGGYDLWIVKLNSTGNVLWQKCLGGSNFDEGQSIQTTDDGGYILAGNTRSNDDDVSGNHGDFDYWILKLNSLGTIQWQKCLGGSNFDEVKSIQTAIDGGYIIAGNTRSNDGNVLNNHGDNDYWIVKLAPSISTGLETNKNNILLKVFPNPSQSQLNLSEKLKSLEIYNSNGQFIKSENETDCLDISTLNTGTYFLKGYTFLGELVETRFIKN
jgi:hypothetical protein